MSTAEEAIRCLAAGEPVVLPADTVYALACNASREDAAHALYRLKGRAETQPTALLAASVDVLLECVPELAGRAEAIARALLPGPFTLVLPNPARRFRWLGGARPDAIGVRVPALPGKAAAVLGGARAIVATSANHPGGPEPRRLADVPAEILAGAACVLDGGELPGVPSTVIDLTAAEPRVLRAGAGDATEALRRIAAAIE